MRKFSLFLICALTLGTVQKSEAMVGAGIAGIVISDSPGEMLGAIPVIALGVAAGFILGNPIALVVDVPRFSEDQVLDALTKTFPFIDDQEVNHHFAALVQAKFDADAAQGFYRPVGLTDEEIESVLADSAQLFNDEQVAEIKRKLQ